jgi:23S rRNA (uracil1939-C5)-methyltransferase
MASSGPVLIVDCPHRVACGACSLLGRPYPEQLEAKRRRLVAALDGAFGRRRAPEVGQTVPSPQIEGYRNRAKLTISTDRDGHSVLGYFERSSRVVVDAPDCRVLVPELLDTSRRLRRLLNSKAGLPYSLRHVDLRCGSDPAVQHLTLVIRAEALPRLPVEAIADACPQVAGIGVNLNPGSGPQVVKGRIEPLAGALEVVVEVAGLALRVSPGSFFQVNLPLLPSIHERMAAFFGRGELLADLYAGVGTHGLALRRGFRRVLCVEGVRGAAADAKASIRAGRVDNVEVLTSPLHRALGRLRSERPDAVVLNPSAAGAEARVLETVVASPATSVAYLSCDPATLARDLAALVAGGFAPVEVRAVDMMPQTAQVEALALLRRPSPRR